MNVWIYIQLDDLSEEFRCSGRGGHLYLKRLHSHTAAGVTLHFAVDIIEVREATAEELEHGHVH